MASLNLELRAMLDDLNNTVLDTDDIDRVRHHPPTHMCIHTPPSTHAI